MHMQQLLWLMGTLLGEATLPFSFYAAFLNGGQRLKERT